MQVQFHTVMMSMFFILIFFIDFLWINFDKKYMCWLRDLTRCERMQ